MSKQVKKQMCSVDLGTTCGSKSYPGYNFCNFSIWSLVAYSTQLTAGEYTNAGEFLTSTDHTQIHYISLKNGLCVSVCVCVQGNLRNHRCLKRLCPFNIPCGIDRVRTVSPAEPKWPTDGHFELRNSTF